MSGGQDSRSAEFVEIVDTVQERLANQHNRRTVLERNDFAFKSQDFDMTNAQLADEFVRLLVVADFRGQSLGEILADRLRGVL